MSLKRGDGSGAAVAAHGVSGGSVRREILGGISPSTGQVSGAINASAEQMLRLKSAGMFWQSIVAKTRDSGLLIKNARGTSGLRNFSPQRVSGPRNVPQTMKDDVVEARKWIPNTPYIINTRARRCACIFIRLAAIKASNCIIVSLDSRRRFILVDLSAKIRTPPL